MSHWVRDIALDAFLFLAVGVGMVGAASCDTAGSVADPGGRSTLAGTGGGSAAAALSPSASPSAAPGLTLPVRRLRRLSNREYDNVVRDLLGDTSQPARLFLADSYVNGYDNGSAALAVQSDQVSTYQTAAEALAADVVAKRLSLVLGGCDVTVQGEPACVDAFLTDFAARAYRRPLTPSESQRLRDVFQVGEQLGGQFADGVATALEVILQSPQFLYREELGADAAAPAAGSAVRLTDYEAASELSFMLTGSVPDASLWSAVQQGSFQTIADYQREATRLLGTPAGKSALRGFLHQWLATDELANINKEATFYPGFTAALAASMSTELDQFYDSVLWEGTGSLRELLTSNKSFVDPTLAQFYGVPDGIPGFHPVTLDPNLRKGVMSRAGFLTVHSNTDSSGPVTRGVFVLDALLCAPPPPPPANVPPAPAPGDPSVQNLTTRQRFANHVSNAVCAGCHTQIDGIGFGFEEFDGIGAYRTTEHGQPIDSTGTIVGTVEIDGDYNGLGELATRIGGSQHLVDCYVRQAYRYAMGQVESDGDSMQALESGFSPDAPMTAVLLAVLANPVFTKRSYEPSAP